MDEDDDDDGDDDDDDDDHDDHNGDDDPPTEQYWSHIWYYWTVGWHVLIYLCIYIHQIFNQTNVYIHTFEYINEKMMNVYIYILL